MQGSNKSRRHIRHAERGNNWLSDMPRSWAKVHRRLGTCRQAREQLRLEAADDAATHDRGEAYERYWTWYGERDNQDNVQYRWYAEWMLERGYEWRPRRGWVRKK